MSAHAMDGAVHALDNDAVGFVGLSYVNSRDCVRSLQMYDLLRKGDSIGDRWNHPQMRFNRYDHDGNLVDQRRAPATFQGDVFASHPLIITARAANALRDLWERYGELLPVPSKDGEFYVYHCLNVLDAIDRLRCQFDWSRITSYVFKPEVVRRQDIFLQAAPNEGPIFVSQIVVDRVHAAGLKGFKFTPVWSEATGPIEEEPPAPIIEIPRHGKQLEPMSTPTKRDVVDKLVAMANHDLKIDIRVDPPGKVLARIRQEASSAQDWVGRFQEAVGVSTVLGTLWGELVCREFGWEWAMVDKTAAIVSPTRSHIIFPHVWFHDLLSQRGNQAKSQELYEMIESGSLPASEAGSKLVLG